MKVSTQSTENRQAVLNIEVEPQEMQESLEIAYHHLVKRVNIPGFRRGKTPRSILERYIGKEELQKEALEHLVPQLCNQAIEEQKMDVVAQPEVEILQVDPVVFKATFSLRPQVYLGEYQQIRLAPDPVEITEEQIDNALERLRDQYSVWSPAQEHPLRLGDLAIIDIEQIEEGNIVNTYTGQQLPVMQDSMLPMPGFAEQLVGMEGGQEREFSLSYPDDYKITGLADKQYNFKVKLIDVKEKQLPELNDEFVKNFGSDLKTIGDPGDSMATSLRNIAEERARRDFEQKVIEAAVDLAKVEFPPILEEQEIDHFITERERMLKGQGGLESYLKNLNKTEKEMREELRPDATRQVIRSLVLNKIAVEEKIELSATEIDTEIEDMLKGAGNSLGELQSLLATQRGAQWVEEKLTLQKTVQCLTQIASGNAVEEGGDTTEDSGNAAEDGSSAAEEEG